MSICFLVMVLKLKVGGVFIRALIKHLDVGIPFGHDGLLLVTISIEQCILVHHIAFTDLQGIHTRIVP